jgi:hypothetical protein
MKRLILFLVITLNSMMVIAADKIAIVYPAKSTSLETLSAKEIRRYIYVRTGRMAELIRTDVVPTGYQTYIIVGTLGTNLVQSFSEKEESGKIISGLNRQEYSIVTLSTLKSKYHVIVGGDEIGTLYGAYKFIEAMGVRFYLDGDVIPDEKLDFTNIKVNEKGKPLFELRGIQPFHDFPEGPDWWNVDDYKAIIAQLPKLRMNFFGLHTYPEGGVGPEPTVWIGMKENSNDEGEVTFSYPSTYNNTFRNAWGYKPKATSNYAFGASRIFECDTFGAAVQKSLLPWPKTPLQQNQVFNQTAHLLNEAFKFAHLLGIKTCVGTEAPLIVPGLLKEELQNEGKGYRDKNVIKKIYEGMFDRIAKSSPIDYYWLWTPEGWTWNGAADSTVSKTEDDILTAYEALKESKAKFQLATCGWVLGPPKDRAEFDRILPKNIPFSCINRNVGRDPVEPQFARIGGREKWAIPWLEEDPLLTQPQFWVGRMRKDAADALKYNCNGLFGIHWRTRILGPNVAALANAAWNQDNFKAITLKNFTGVEVLGGNTEEYPATILNRNQLEQYLYKTFRGGLEGYDITLPNGYYSLTLKMVDCYYDQADKRVFDVIVQGKKVLANVDIAANVGRFNAYDRMIEKVKVDEGKLSIRFVPVKDVPNISALVIEGENYNIKINCGGDDYMDYTSDVSIQNSTRYLDASDFYLDWAAINFGKENATEIAAIFASIDGHFPTPTSWMNGPGGIKPNKNDLEVEMRKYDFVDKFQVIQPKINGAGNIDRFRYWLNTMKYFKEMAKTGCWAGALEQAVDELKQTPPAEQKSIVLQKVIPIRNELMNCYSNMMGYLLSTVTNMSELGTIMNIESHIMAPDKNILNRYDSLVQKISDMTLVKPSSEYTGEARIIVITNRTSLTNGENLYLKVILLGQHDPGKSFLHWKTLGAKEYRHIPLKHIGRNVYEVILPASDIGGNDFEYYISSQASGKMLVIPATSPTINRSVVIM